MCREDPPVDDSIDGHVSPYAGSPTILDYGFDFSVVAWASQADDMSDRTDDTFRYCYCVGRAFNGCRCVDLPSGIDGTPGALVVDRDSIPQADVRIVPTSHLLPCPL